MAIAAARKRSSPKTNTTDSPFPSSSGTPPATREHSPQKFDHGHGHSLHVHIPDIPEPMRYRCDCNALRAASRDLTVLQSSVREARVTPFSVSVPAYRFEAYV